MFTLFLIAFIFFIYCAIFHSGYVSKNEMMSFEKCDRTSCEYCVDLEQCNVRN